MSLDIFIKAGVSSLKQFLFNYFAFAEMSLSFLIDKILQERKKAIFTMFSVMNFFEHNVTYNPGKINGSKCRGHSAGDIQV